MSMVPQERRWTDQYGRNWRELSRDFSQIPEHDRPPQVICENLHAGDRLHYDRSDTREPIPVEKGKDIRGLGGLYRGGRVALLFNGHSLPKPEDLYRINSPIIGMNRTFVGYETYQGPSPDWLCVVDVSWLSRAAVRHHRGLINATSDPRPIGWRVPKSYRMAPFSFDLYRDGALPTTTGLVALQVAAYLGFRDLYCFGLDLRGAHYDGTRSGGNMGAQLRYMTVAAPLLREAGVRVWLVGSPESAAKDLFPHLSFEDFIQGEPA